jgi:hypothetical protein
MKRYHFTSDIYMMKGLVLALIYAMFALPVSAQMRRGYHRPAPSRHSHPMRSHYGSHSDFMLGENTYFGLRFGLSASSVHSDDQYLNGSGVQSGYNIGGVVGFQLSYFAPVFFETGLSYIEKGGKGSFGGNKFTYDLNYLEVPLVLKYRYVVAPTTAIEPFLGGYLACGVGGQIRDFGDRAAYGSFSDNNFNRFDGGIRIGCGAAFSMLYAELGYDLGLSNISKDYFDASHNGCFFVNIGLNF